MSTPAPEVRDQLAIALDVDDLIEARRLAKELSPYFGVAKIGLELFSAVGPDVVGIVAEMGYRVFLDVKLHDNPSIVERTSRVLGSIGVSYLTFHAFGGAPMLRAGVDGLNEGAERAGLDAPEALAVTILTGDDDAPPHILGNRIRTAVEGGAKGIVCSTNDIKEAKLLAPRLHAVVTGIRPTGAPEDQYEVAATPQAALDNGADLLVLGRAITAAPDRVQAAEDLVKSLS